MVVGEGILTKPTAFPTKRRHSQREGILGFCSKTEFWANFEFEGIFLLATAFSENSCMSGYSPVRDRRGPSHGPLRHERFLKNGNRTERSCEVGEQPKETKPMRIHTILYRVAREWTQHIHPNSVGSTWAHRFDLSAMPSIFNNRYRFCKFLFCAFCAGATSQRDLPTRFVGKISAHTHQP